MQLWNSAKVKLRYMLLFQNCCGVSSFSANAHLSQESKETKGSYVPFCFHQENSEQRPTRLQRFSLVLPDLNLFLFLISIVLWTELTSVMCASGPVLVKSRTLNNLVSSFL